MLLTACGCAPQVIEKRKEQAEAQAMEAEREEERKRQQVGRWSAAGGSGAQHGMKVWLLALHMLSATLTLSGQP